MHYLFAIWDGGGAVPPQLALARGLIDRGHTVTVLADPTLEGEVSAARAEFRSWRRAPHRRTQDETIADDRGISNPSRLVQLLLDELVAAPSARFAADVRDADRERRADVIVAEMPLLGALAAGQALRRPTVALMTLCYAAPHPDLPPFGTGFGPGVGPMSRFRNKIVARLAERLWDRGVEALDATRAELGLGPVGRHLWDQLRQVDRVLVLTSREFDFPCSTLPANVRYVGPQLADPAWAGKDVTLPPGAEPLVLVSFSSTPMEQVSLLRRTLRSLADLPVRALVTTGPAVDPDEVIADVRLRPGISVVRSAPHGAVLTHAAAVVTHAGHGTVVKALSAGVPLVCLPIGRDQPDNAARVVAAGAGIRLKSSASVSAIAQAVERVCSDEAYRSAARTLGASLAREAVSGAGLDELEAIARESAASHR